MSNADLTPCPSCGKDVHAAARACPTCGFEPERTRLQELWSSLVTVSSILAGFSLAALVQMITGEAREAESVSFHIAAALLIVSSLLLLTVILGAESLRLQDPALGAMRHSERREQRDRSVSHWLLGTFLIALVLSAASIVLLGFFHHVYIGGIGVGVGALCVLLLWRCR